MIQTTTQTDTEIGERALRKSVEETEKIILEEKRFTPILFYWTGKKGMKKNVIYMEDIEGFGEEEVKSFFDKTGQEIYNKNKNVKVFVLCTHGHLVTPQAEHYSAVLFDVLTINCNRKSDFFILEKENTRRSIFVKKPEIQKESDSGWISIRKESLFDRGAYLLLKRIFVTYKFKKDFQWAEKAVI